MGSQQPGSRPALRCPVPAGVGAQRGLVLLAGLRACRVEHLGNPGAPGYWRTGWGKGRRLWPKQRAGAGGNRGNLCGQRGGSAPGRPGAPPGPRRPPLERERLFVRAGLQLRAVERRLGRSPVWSPLEGRGDEELRRNSFCPPSSQVVGSGGAGRAPFAGGRWRDPRSPSRVMDPAMVLPLFGECCWLCQLYGTWLPTGAVLKAEELPGDRCVGKGWLSVLGPY